MAENPTADDLKAPLLAAVGAADLALATVNEILASLRERAEDLRERAEDVRSDASTRVEERRARLTQLQEELPSQFDELRDRFTSDELRKAAEGYAETATIMFNTLVERGEAALERLRTQPAVEDATARAEEYVELTQEALGNVATQTRAVGERAAKLVGVELPAKAPAKKAAKKAPAKKAAKKASAKKAAKKAPAKKVTQK